MGGDKGGILIVYRVANTTSEIEVVFVFSNAT